jgi:hypothetical protein
MVVSVGQTEITPSGRSFNATAPITQLRGAKIIPSAQTEEPEHEKNDDNGTNKPDDSVHDEDPLLARVESKRDWSAPIGTVPRNPI